MPGFVSVDFTLCSQAALSAWHRLLTRGQTVGSSRSVHVCGCRLFGLGKVQRCWGVTQAVSTAAVLVHHSGLGLLNNSVWCGNKAAYILRGKIINLYWRQMYTTRKRLLLGYLPGVDWLLFSVRTVTDWLFIVVGEQQAYEKWEKQSNE